MDELSSSDKCTLKYYKIEEECEMEEYLSENRKYKYECFAMQTREAQFNSLKSKWDTSVLNVCPLCSEVGETEEHVLLECVGLENERGLIKQYLKEEEKEGGVVVDMDQLPRVHQMQRVLGLGGIYKGKNVKVLEIVGLMLYKWNKAQLQIQRRK